MIDLPSELLARLFAERASEEFPAWLRVSADGRVRDAGGRLAHYDLREDSAGSRAETVLPALAGMLPPREDELVLPVANLGDAALAEVCLLRDGEQAWVLLLDAGGRAAEIRAARQGENEWRLLTERLLARGDAADRAVRRANVSVVAVRVSPRAEPERTPRSVVAAVVKTIDAVRTLLAEETAVVERRSAQLVIALFEGEGPEGARAAVAAANRVPDALAALPGTEDVQVGVGVATGPVLLGEPPAAPGVTPLVVGEALERALDLAAAAIGAGPELDAASRRACGLEVALTPRATRRALDAAVEALGSVVLVPSELGELHAVSPCPEWLSALFEPLDAEGRRWRPRVDQPFLRHALAEAEELWRGGVPARIRMGPWEAIGAGERERFFESWAVLRDDRSRALVITAMEERHDELQRILQRAREARLGHDALVREVEKKEVLLHCIVHDLRGPLTTIQGGLSLLSRGGLPEARERRVIELAARQAGKQEEMIRSILEVFAAELRVLVGVEADPRAAPDLAAAVLDAAERHADQAERSGLRLKTSVGDPRPLPVLARRDRLDRVLDNLILNALRHSPSGGSVFLSVEPQADHALLVVEDEGPGVAEELRPRLFERFARGSDGGLAGLGLYACRLAVHSWGGEVGYEPRDGGSARFWVRLKRTHAGGVGNESGAGES